MTDREMRADCLRMAHDPITITTWRELHPQTQAAWLRVLDAAYEMLTSAVEGRCALKTERVGDYQVSASAFAKGVFEYSLFVGTVRVAQMANFRTLDEALRMGVDHAQRLAAGPVKRARAA
jgi:hypothetical protein